MVWNSEADLSDCIWRWRVEGDLPFDIVNMLDECSLKGWMLASSTLALLSLPRTPMVRCSGIELGWIVILRVGQLKQAVYVSDLRLDLMMVCAIVY